MNDTRHDDINDSSITRRTIDLLGRDVAVYTAAMHGPGFVLPAHKPPNLRARASIATRQRGSVSKRRVKVTLPKLSFME